jgi:hypothetical protein
MVSIEWSREHLWDIKFPDPNGAPAPFNRWFPATNVFVPMAILKSKTFEGPLSEYSIPIKTEEKRMSVTFFDDTTHKLLDWITYWMNSTFGSTLVSSTSGYFITSYVKTLEKITRRIDISRLDSNKSEIILSNGDVYVDSYLVYPEDVIGFKGGNEPKPNSYAVRFVIAGIIKQNFIINMLGRGVAIQQ